MLRGFDPRPGAGRRGGAEIFVRPKRSVAKEAVDLEGFDSRIEGTVTSLLFNGAASRILVRVPPPMKRSR